MSATPPVHATPPPGWYPVQSRRNLQRWWDGQSWGDQLLSNGTQVSVGQARKNIKVATALWSIPVALVLVLSLVWAFVYGYPHWLFAGLLMGALYVAMLTVNVGRLRSIPLVK